jgi:hypothetical protein
MFIGLGHQKFCGHFLRPGSCEGLYSLRRLFLTYPSADGRGVIWSFVCIMCIVLFIVYCFVYCVLPCLVCIVSLCLFAGGRGGV